MSEPTRRRPRAKNLMPYTKQDDQSQFSSKSTYRFGGKC